MELGLSQNCQHSYHHQANTQIPMLQTKVGIAYVCLGLIENTVQFNNINLYIYLHRKYRMSKQFMENLLKLNQRPLDVAVSVKIDSQSYQIFVSQKHTIQNIIDRFKRNEFFSYKDPVVIMNSEPVDKERTIAKLKQSIKNDEQISLQIRSESGLDKVQSIGQADLVTRSMAGQSIKSDPSTEYSFDKSSSSCRQQSTNVNISHPPLARIEERNELRRIPSEQPYISLSQFRQLLESSKSSQQTLQMSQISRNSEFKEILMLHLRHDNEQPILKMLKRFNSPNLNEEVDYSSLSQMKNFNEVKNQLQMIRDALLTVNENQKFNKDALERIKKVSTKLSWVNQLVSQTKHFKTPFSEKGSSIDRLGSDQHQLMQEIEKIEASVNKMQNFKFENKLSQSQNKIKLLHDEIIRLKAEVKQAEDSLNEALIERSSFSKERTPFTISTTILNKENQGGMQNLQKQILKYEKQKQGSPQEYVIRELQTIMTLRKTEIQWESIASYLDLIQFGKYDRVVLLLQFANEKTVLAVYSTYGIIGSKQPKKKETPTSRFQSQCRDSSGFIYNITHQSASALQSIDGEPLLWYDDKFITIANCLNIMINHKRKMEIHYKEARKGSLRDDGEQLDKLFANRKKIEVASLQLFRVHVETASANVGGNQKIEQTVCSSVKSGPQAKKQTV